MHNKDVIALSSILLVGFLFIWGRCSLSCSSQGLIEQYKTQSPSESGFLKHSPDIEVIRRGGSDDFDNKIVPLEYGVDFYPHDRKIITGQMHAELNECYHPKSKNATHVTNDGRTRAAMVDSGDISWHRTLKNMTHAGHAKSKSARPIESDFATADSKDYNQGLYHPSYHKDKIDNGIYF